MDDWSSSRSGTIEEGRCSLVRCAEMERAREIEGGRDMRERERGVFEKEALFGNRNRPGEVQ